MSQIEPDSSLLDPLLMRVFPAGPTHVERVAEGVSTWVYRIRYRDSTFYLRVLPEAGASFAPEVAVHTALLLPGLLRGYAGVTTIPADVEKRILFASLLINVRALARACANALPIASRNTSWTFYALILPHWRPSVLLRSLRAPTVICEGSGTLQGMRQKYLRRDLLC